MRECQFFVDFQDFIGKIYIKSGYKHLLYAYKAVKQDFIPSDNIKVMMSRFTEMVNLVITVMIDRNLTSRNSASKEIYPMLREYSMPSYYYPEAINKAVALVKTYRKRMRKKKKASVPHVNRGMISTYYGFRIDNGNLLVPIANRQYAAIPLNNHTIDVISDVKVHSFALSECTLSLTIGKDVDPIECTITVGVDRNLRNAAVGNETHHEVYDLSEVVKIKQRYRKMKSNFHRNDRRIQKQIASKYGKRESNRVRQIIHEAS